MLVFNESIGEMDALNEMSYACKKSDGYGIIIQINSDDHGNIDSENSPAHAHLLTTEGKEIAEFEITSKPPKKPADIRWYRTERIPDGYGKIITDWARAKNKHGFNNWASLKYLWTARKPN